MISIEPTRETIASCSSCGKPNYHGGIGSTAPEGTEEYAPNGLKLFDLGIQHNEFQCTILHFCSACLQELNEVIYPHRLGINEQPTEQSPNTDRYGFLLDAEVAK